MQKTVYVLHTSFALVDVMKKLFAELTPEARIVNLVDDSLLADVRANGSVPASVTRRMVGYGILAQSAGADAVFNCCSSVAEAADLMASSLDIPVVKIDDKMAEEAVQSGSRVGVIATVMTTLDPTERLLHRKAAAQGKPLVVTRYLVEGAFDALMAGDSAKHDQLLLAEIERAAAENDAVVLAQGSMARLVPLVQDKVSVPVLSSPRLGVEALRQVLQGDAIALAAQR